MIKINLLPLESFEQNASGKLAVIVFVVVMAAACFALFMAHTVIMGPAEELLVKNKEDTNKKLIQLKSASAKATVQTKNFVNDYLQVGAISELEERRRDQARLFMSLAGQINNQTSWILSFVHDKNTVNIKGLATDNETVAELLDRMEKLEFLKRVELQRAARDSTINGLRLVTFTIKADTVFPLPSLISEGIEEVKLPKLDKVIELVKVAAPDLVPDIEKLSGPEPPKAL
ncbi:MAG: PilN domain-containing protein [Deltaproteobacteria bacterium]|jgi:Tfp pilus assembly protein PilN|nr:PilN domain-containing protein [Deltaproteobacteria bacterium]